MLYEQSELVEWQRNQATKARFQEIEAERDALVDLCRQAWAFLDELAEVLDQAARRGDSVVDIVNRLAYGSLTSELNAAIATREEEGS